MATTDTQINNKSISFWWTMVVATLLLVFGLPIAAGGVWLIGLGGSWYYLPAGIALLGTAYLLYRRDQRALWVFLLTFAVTLAWSVWEVGFDGWLLVPRLLAPFVILILVATTLPALGGSSPRLRKASLASTGVVAGILAIVGIASNGSSSAAAQDASTAQLAMQAGADLAHQTGADWPAYGGTEHGLRYSSLTQINKGNVDQLERIWEFRTGDMQNGQVSFSNQNTPIKIGNSLFICSAMNKVSALDASTGKPFWTFDPKVAEDAVVNSAACRGLVHVDAPGTQAGGSCAARVVLFTHDARMIALDAKTGRPCSTFGNGGIVNLMDGIGSFPPGFYGNASPATLVRGVLVVGSGIRDNQSRAAPSGVIRGYDAVTGAFKWAWDMGRPGQTGQPAAGQTYTPATPNMWTIASGDEKLGLVYLPLGNSAADYWGGKRPDADNRYSSAIVALDAETGRERWHYQTVHYDLWDYDLGSQGTLVDFPTAAGPVPAIIVPSKVGQFFILNRATGKPLVNIVEAKAPRGGVEPARRSPTQPFVTDFPNVLKPRLREVDMWGATPLDQLFCRIQFRQAAYDGAYTSPTADRPWIESPGYNGGSDWGSVAVDPRSGIMIANYNNVPNYNRLIPRAQFDKTGVRAINDPEYTPNAAGGGHGQLGPQAKTPYGVRVNAGWRVPFTGMVCTKPPYGGIMAIDLKTRKILWDRPFGTALKNGPFGIPTMLPLPIGTPNNGGGFITASGLFFIAAATDDLLRAIDIRTGKEVWKAKLPAGGQATPMTYEAGGRQIIVINAGGHNFMETKVGDYFIAYALPKGSS